MAEYILENEPFKAVVSSKGCELISVVRKTDGREYLWCGAPEIWKRHAPVLFPLVGKYRNDTVRHDGKTYHMTQHGFARDLEFELTEQTDTSVWMRLAATPDTKEQYPFDFILYCGYQLTENRVSVFWRVENKDTETLYFSLGGHPAFTCGQERSGNSASMAGCTLAFNTFQPVIRYRLLNQEGLVAENINGLALGQQGRVSVTPDFFDRDAYIIEHNQCHCVSLEQDGKAFVTVSFDAPVFGLWSPPHKNVPFVCIEPWYGRADSADFDGALKERAWGNELAPGETFRARYEILFG